MDSLKPTRLGVVMAGGYGERFWPLSKPERPKQLLKLTHPDQTMLEEAIHRMDPIVEHVYVSTSELLAPALEQSGIAEAGDIFAEPARRNTLGALCWTVANLIARGYREATVGVVTADHAIGSVDRFQGAVEAALTVAETAGGLVTLGIRPTRPETGYGYIEIDSRRAIELGEWTAYASNAFREKPDAETAEVYASSGQHLWNGGMFFFTIPEFLRELSATAPDAHQTTLRISEALEVGDEDRACECFSELPNLSIDYAVMEQAQVVHVVPVDFPWDDVGAWDSLERTLPPDEEGNVRQGKAVLLDVKSSVVVNDEDGKIVALLGVEDLVVVNTGDAILVCHKSQAQRVKQLVARVGEVS
ncbi:MAG TPA: sugar phosphate nucleotidyltransferase [Fimbriimonas sp.]|nr:sugar phosphate nucleotidyltransferase [Fimbriimonas sp.]